MKCTGEKSWHCIDGSCEKNYFFCSSYSTKCTDYPNQYYCGLHNGDSCVLSDVHCMRECGTKLKSYTFDVPCAGFSGKCAWMPSTCPIACVKCPNSNRCEKSLAFCEPCWKFRCANTGKCISSFRHCNNVDDCGDFSDEMNCGLSEGDGTSTSTSDTADLSGITVGISVGLIMFIVVLVCVIIIIRKRRRNQSRGTVVSQHEPGGRPTGGPTIVGATPIANPPRIAGATDPYGSNSRLVPPTQTLYAVVPTAPAGSSHSLNSAIGHPSAAPPPSYDEVLDNQMQFKRVDTELPSYEDAEHIPPINPNYSSTSSV